MSFTASVQQSTALIAKKTKAGMEVWIPKISRNCREKMVNPVIPATPMNRYDQISVHPERTPPTAPRPRPI
jgi:hypothetical protein